MASAPLRALLAGSIDYAGLFPPAALSLPAVCAEYLAAGASAQSWALGRLVLPADRLAEAAALMPVHGAPWPVSVLIGDDLARDAASIHAAIAHGVFHVQAAEARTPTLHAIEDAANAVGTACALYAEIPLDADPAPRVDCIARTGAKAKMRTGGVMPDAFPPPVQVARFIHCCTARGVSFKATAGLHHPLRGEYRLTYEATAPLGIMFGFLNVFVATALARQGLGEGILVALLQERDPAAIQFDANGIRWREYFVSTDEMIATRADSATGFGSCSFREPLDDLHQLGLL